MQKENGFSEYFPQDEAVTAYSLPYVDTTPPTPSDPQPTPSVPQSEQQNAHLTEIDQIAAAHQLGRIQKVLKYDVSSSMTAGITSCLLGIICFIPIILLVINIGYFRGLFWLAFFGFGAFAYGINRINGALNNLGAKALTLNQCYYLCTHGIMLTRGTKVQSIRWDQVKAIQIIPAANSIIPLEYVLYPSNDSEPLVLAKVCIRTKPTRLQIEHEITRRLLPTCIKAYKDNQILNFGPINLTSQGLVRIEDETLLPWENLGATGESREFFIIREKGSPSPWARIDISTMLNLCVFWPLLEEIRRDQRAKEKPQSTLINQSLAYIPTQQSEWQEYE